jgi:transposase
MTNMHLTLDQVNQTTQPNRKEHRAGEKLFVDYARTRLQIHDPLGGPAREASLFVAVLGASSYTFAEATGSQELEG